MKKARTVGFKRGERNIFFHILTACNLSCSHCYINPEQHGSNTLSLSTIKKWLDLFIDSNKKSNVIFLGGEPTMHKDLPGAVRYAKEKGLAVTVDSNGYLLHDFLESVTPADVDFLSFSLDGPEPAINDPIRGEGVFEVCTANIKRAVAKGFNVSLIFTVSRKNIDHLERMLPVLKQLGVKKFFIQVIGLRGNSAKNDVPDSLQVGRKEWLSVVPKVAAKIAGEGIKVTYPKVFLDRDEEFGCAGNEAENYFIFPNGRVYRCPLCEDHPIHALRIENDALVVNEGLTEDNFFQLNIAEGCVMNKLLQPDTIEYDEEGQPLYRISCCLLKQEIE
ncbi:radical SAM protein [Desulfopila sp. IMCC35008]|uniref:radical SAM protein n=1 Tax=Desulfopila sp. IMCC35008 TaxID=2653858 RepID=UPI0013D1CAB4|nr:radical SAM protein [Desulfopila sp. IMCC35008]